MARNTNTDFPTAYRLVIIRTLAGVEHIEYVGPFQTKPAAKGQLTEYLRERSYEHYDSKVGYIERTTGPWERVES